MGKETLEITYDMAKEIISRDLETMSQKFISIGYHLKLIRDKHLYTQDGYKDIWVAVHPHFGTFYRAAPHHLVYEILWE